MTQESANMSYKYQSRQKEQLKSVMEDNSRLNDELLSMIRRSRGEGAQEYQVAEDPRTVEQFYPKQSHRKKLDEDDNKRDTVMTFGDMKRSVKGSERKNSEESLASLRLPQWGKGEEQPEPQDHKQRDLKDALEYMKKREKALQEEVKLLNQTILKKDHLIVAVENKNRILLANNIDLQSKSQQVFEHSETILQKYRALREINEGLQKRLGQLEEEGGLKEHTQN